MCVCVYKCLLIKACDLCNYRKFKNETIVYIQAFIEYDYETYDDILIFVFVCSPSERSWMF